MVQDKRYCFIYIVEAWQSNKIGIAWYLHGKMVSFCGKEVVEIFQFLFSNILNSYKMSFGESARFLID